MAKQGFWGLVLWALAGMAQAVTCVGNIVPTNPDAIYTVHGDGTVTDTRTGLMWKQCVEGLSGTDCATGSAQNMTWADALNHAENHDFAGFDDWRMPNQYELRSLVEHCRHSPAINDTVFPNTPSSVVWSGSPYANYSDYAWGVDFNLGLAYVNGYNFSRSDHYQVRLVRGGQSFDPSDPEPEPQPQTTFLSENLPDGTFQIGPTTKRWRFRNGPLPLSGVTAQRVSADASLGISIMQVPLGSIAANAEFVVEVPVNPVRGGVAVPRSVWKLVDGQGNDVPITNSPSNTFWMALRTNRPPRWSPAQLTSIGGSHGVALSLPLLATDADGDALSFSVVSGGGNIDNGHALWSGTAHSVGGETEVQQLVLRVSDGLENATIGISRVVYGANGLANFFADVPAVGDTNDVYAATHFLAGKGIVLGCGSNEQGERIFCPDAHVTQAEGLKMLLRTAEERGLLVVAPAPFVPEHFFDMESDPPVNYTWAASYAFAALHLGVIEDVETWNPAALLTRADLARWVDRLLALEVPISVMDAMGTLDLYRFTDAGDFESTEDYDAARRTAFFTYHGSLGNAFSPNALVTRGQFARVAARVLRAPEISGLQFVGTTLKERFGETLPTVTHGETFAITNVQGLIAREILMSGDRVLDEWIEPAVNYVRVAVALPDGTALGTFRYVKDFPGNPMVLDTDQLAIHADTRLELLVLIEAHRDAPGQDVPRSGLRAAYRIPIAVDFPDRDGDGVRDDLDEWPDDHRYTVDSHGLGYPDEVTALLARLGLNPADPVMLDGVDAGYTHGQALMEGWEPYTEEAGLPEPGDLPLLHVAETGGGTVLRSPAGEVVWRVGSTLWVEYPAGTVVGLTAQPHAGSQFIGWNGVCTGTSLSCQVTLDANGDVSAAFAPVSGGGGNPGDMGGVGSGTVAGNAPGADGTPGTGGQVTAQASGGTGGGNTGWVFTEASILAPPQGRGLTHADLRKAGIDPTGLPDGVVFPYGLIDFSLALGQPGSDATVVLSYPEPLPPGTKYYKYGTTPDNPVPHWYVLEEAQINGEIVGISLTDGGLGDDDGWVNGIIKDPSGPAVPDVRIFEDGFEGELLPAAPNLWATPPGNVEPGTPVTLHWGGSSNAQGCEVMGPAGIPNWSGEMLPPSGSRTVMFPGSGSIQFSIRCFNDAGVSPVASVVVTSFPQPAGGCSGYLANMDGAARAHYDAYNAELRGFSKFETTFTAKTGKTLGVDTGSINALPGILGENQYLALAFTLPGSGGSNTGRFRLDYFDGPLPALEHEVVITISPCPGDFRPRDGAGGSDFTRPQCRTSYGMSGTLRGNVQAGSQECAIPAGEPMYMNIGLRNMYSSGAIPSSSCPSGQLCGVGGALSN